jgi:hypothetical protein
VPLKLKPRADAEVLESIGNLPQINVATNAEVLFYLEQHQLMGRGIGYIDTHLLASSALAGPIKLWTLDGRLATLAGELGMRN